VIAKVVADGHLKPSPDKEVNEVSTLSENSDRVEYQSQDMMNITRFALEAAEGTIEVASSIEKMSGSTQESTLAAEQIKTCGMEVAEGVSKLLNAFDAFLNQLQK